MGKAGNALRTGYALLDVVVSSGSAHASLGLQLVGVNVRFRPNFLWHTGCTSTMQSGLQHTETGNSRQLPRCSPQLEELPPVGVAALPVAH